MRSAFFEFHVAKSGLFLARGALEVVAHNTANAANKGYSRQYVETRATTPLTYYDGRGMIGTGAEIYGVGQYRNFYLDKKYWSESAVYGEYSSKYTQMGMVEKVFRELADTGTTSGLNLFFKTLEDLSTTAGDPTYRTNVLQAAQGLTKYINNTAESLKKYQRDINEEVKAVTQCINSLANQIASLNRQISVMEMDGSRANDLRDARALLVDELSQYVNIEVSEIERNEDYAAGKYPEPEDRGKSNKEFIVFMNGNELVKGQDVNNLVTVARDNPADSRSGTKNNPMDAAGLYDIYFSNGFKLDIYSGTLKGQLKGLIDSRDGNNALYFQGTCSAAIPAPPPVAQTTLTLTPSAASRLDLNNADGTITVTDAAGRKVELRYTGYSINAVTGDVTFTFDAGAMDKAAGMTITGATVGKTTDYKGIPHYMDKLNELVRTLAMAFNEGKNRNGDKIPGVLGHANGYDWPDDENKGLLFFTYKNDTFGKVVNDLEYYKINCLNFSVNQQLIGNPELLACSSEQGAGESQNKVILQFLEIKNYKSLFGEGKLSDFVIGISSELGIDVNQAKKFSTNYNEVTKAIDLQRMSVSGVDLSEEMTDMVKYQHMYQAASKLINVIDGIYDTTINRLGLI